MTVSVEALVFIVIGRSCFLRFNSRPIMSSPYCLWLIVKTSIMSDNDGITVRQTVAHTAQLWPRGLGTPRGSRLSRRKAQ